jgi:hypothetical protein
MAERIPTDSEWTLIAQIDDEAHRAGNAAWTRAFNEARLVHPGDQSTLIRIADDARRAARNAYRVESPVGWYWTD